MGSFGEATPFPVTDAERAACVAEWRNISHPRAKGAVMTRRFGQVDFNDIHFDQTNIIGDGGSCVVYKAPVFGMICAVKVLPLQASGWEEQQFDSEVKLLSAVQHPHLCRYYACSVNGPQKCLLLEPMDQSLDKRLFSQPALGWQQCVWIALNICRGISFLHSLSPPVIHRDVKSQNVLINGFVTQLLDKSSVAKVADFGTVRLNEIHITTTNGDTTVAGSRWKTDGKTHNTTMKVVGTGPYMPAECE
jgi:serine/threonine protein kinase